MALIDALRRGVLGTIRQLRQVGGTTVSIISYIRQQLPELTLRDVSSAVNASIRAANTGGQYQNLAPGDRIPATSMQRISGIPRQYQFTVTVEFHGAGGGRSTFRTLTIDSDRNLTREELEGRAYHLARVLFLEGMGLAPVDSALTSGQMSVSVEYVFRSR